MTEKEAGNVPIAHKDTCKFYAYIIPKLFYCNAAGFSRVYLWKKKLPTKLRILLMAIKRSLRKMNGLENHLYSRAKVQSPV